MTTLGDAPASNAAAARSPGRRGGLVLAVVLALAVLGVLAVGLRTGVGPARPAGLLEQPAPPLRGTTLTGDAFDLEDWRGHVVLVNVWASWCAPCRDEMPLLASVQRRHGADGLRVVGIDTNDDADAARRFVAQTGADFPHVLDPDARLAVEWGTSGVPETYVVDRDGTVVAKRFGEVTPAWLADTLPALLARP